MTDTAATHRAEAPPARAVVVGAGHAGGTLVALLRQTGYDGEIEVIGAEAHRPYHRPPLSKQFLDEDRVQWLRDPDFYREQGITLTLQETVLDVDRGAGQVRTSSGRTVAYDALVLATGALPRTLPLPGLDLDGVVALRTLDDAERLRGLVATGGPLVVIGGGYVGLEVAGVAREAGVEVTVWNARTGCSPESPARLSRRSSPTTTDAGAPRSSSARTSWDSRARARG